MLFVAVPVILMALNVNCTESKNIDISVSWKNTGKCAVRFLMAAQEIKPLRKRLGTKKKKK